MISHLNKLIIIYIVGQLTLFGIIKSAEQTDFIPVVKNCQQVRSYSYSYDIMYERFTINNFSTQKQKYSKGDLRKLLFIVEDQYQYANTSSLSVEQFSALYADHVFLRCVNSISNSYVNTKQR